MHSLLSSTLVLTSLSCLLPLAAQALPASARLFQLTYGYKVSCLLCHGSAGGSEANGYGKAFLRAGANSSAFKKIEDLDSDSDGVPNIKEILAQSNPGDRNSRPGNRGDWLANAQSVPIPQKELEALFPGYSKFSAIEGALNSQQIEFLRSKMGRNPVDDDRVPTFYFAEKEGKRVAVGQLVLEHEADGRFLSTGIAVATSGKVLGIKLMGGSDSLAKSLQSKESFLKTYVGKSTVDLPPKPSDVATGLIHSSVERSLWLLQAVFGPGAP